jgi:competence protein ComFC
MNVFPWHVIHACGFYVLDFIFPKRCVGCRKIGKYFCDRCASKIRIIKTNESICPVCEKPAIDGATHPRCRGRYTIDGLTSFFRYDGVVKKAVKEIKYRFVSDLAEEFVSLISDSLIRQIPDPLRRSVSEASQVGNDREILIPVPLHPSRLRHRGFNQAEVLGKYISTRLHVPMKTNILFRSKKTIPQVEMKDRKTRLKNMDNVFSIHNSLFSIHNSKIILFDDVFTTGATMRDAAGILKRCGVKFVWGVTMAR